MKPRDTDRLLARYIARHAEPEARHIAASPPSGRWNHLVCVPACREEPSTIARLLTSLVAAVNYTPHRSCLLILTVNAHTRASEATHRANQHLLQHLDGILTPTSNPSIRAYQTVDVLVLNRATPDALIPWKQGVGLARKIAADVATALVQQQRSTSAWIYCLDADTEVPVHYFELAKQASAKVVAITPPFRHTFPDDLAVATAGQLYELSLRYYVLGLAWAGSPYAYHTLGSALVVRPAAYAAVRGFPKRSAGEDFYLLAKLAKIGRILRASGAPLRIQGRPSDRVPFGTGPAILNWAARTDVLHAFPLYDPRTFGVLRAWLDHLPTQLLHHTAPSDTLDALLPADTHSAVERARNASSNNGVQVRHLHTWFDALKTLKLVHAARDAHWPSVPWQDALRRAPFWTQPVAEGRGAAVESSKEAWRLESEHLSGTLAGITLR